ncbi:hypothetical protein QF031_002226 [Pseudarthrobacter defluvii]|uniref:hypothetical protein n=1 Tax=Pseudarthrobacter defluvii TaxID=410837 RepID=UPI00278428CD|nr:hypothetical protein [Pseudarthrobacter defluvii]MDQ0769477.1 hypothetical protein [Pseudarthrobacter defluvii]
MWMLIRANDMGAQTGPSGARILAANPDSAERGDPWRWTVELDESAAEPLAAVTANDDHVSASSTRYEGNFTGVFQREAGEQIVMAGLTGEALVAAEDGPWKRWLRPGDTFIVEGEDPEAIRLSLTAGHSAVQVITLSPTRAKVLRWVP